MNLKDLNSKILDLIPFKKMKELVKNLVEKLESSNQKNTQLIEENRELKSRMRELIGEQKLPEFKSKKKSKERDPNKEYKEPKEKGPGRGKRGTKVHKINIDRKEKLEIDKSILPEDAQFKGRRKVIVQEIEFKSENIEFSIPRYYSPSLKKYFEADLPNGFKGHEFGPKLRAFILMMNVQCRVTENKIKSIFDTIGTHISIGHINKVTQTIPHHILSEMIEAKESAIKKQPEVHIDASGININGIGHYMQCICNKYFSWFDLLKNRSRYEVLKGLIGSHKVFKYIINQSTIRWLLRRMKDGDFIKKIRKYIGYKFLSEEELELFIERLDWKNKTDLKNLRVGSLLIAYNEGIMGDSVTNLISDDAKEYKDIVSGHQLCWIHELRHYRLINITTGFTKEIMDNFFNIVWNFYREMSDYKINPSLEKRKSIEDKFKTIFETSWNNHHIDSLRKNTIIRKKGLLTFLDYPNIEIHNNSCEFDIREKVVKKKISYGHKSIEGCNNGNFWLSLFHTCRKNKIFFWEFLIDRYSDAKRIPQLSEIILTLP